MLTRVHIVISFTDTLNDKNEICFKTSSISEFGNSTINNRKSHCFIEMKKCCFHRRHEHIKRNKNLKCLNAFGHSSLVVKSLVVQAK